MEFGNDMFNPLGGPLGGPLGNRLFPFTFKDNFKCYSMAISTKESVEVLNGGKILMPPSALEKLARLNITYPMLFKLSRGDCFTHCGVLEFIAEEGRIYVPHWVRQPFIPHWAKHI